MRIETDCHIDKQVVMTLDCGFVWFKDFDEVAILSLRLLINAK